MPSFAGFREAIQSGRLKAGAPETKHVLGKMFLASFLSGVATPGFDVAVQQQARAPDGSSAASSA